MRSFQRTIYTPYVRFVNLGRLSFKMIVFLFSSCDVDLHASLYVGQRVGLLPKFARESSLVSLVCIFDGLTTIIFLLDIHARGTRPYSVFQNWASICPNEAWSNSLLLFIYHLIWCCACAVEREWSFTAILRHFG